VNPGKPQRPVVSGLNGPTFGLVEKQKILDTFKIFRWLRRSGALKVCGTILFGTDFAQF